MKKALRIGYNQYYDDKLFADHLLFVKENISVIDEIAMFAEFSHYGYWDLETSEKNARVMKNRIKQYRDAGVKSVGINLLCTIGHIEEGWDVFPKAPFQYMVNENGIESKACLCPASQQFLEHTAKRYALYSEIGADFIWMDDDMRLFNHGVVNGFCYCSECIQKFNSENNTAFSRDELVELINTDSKTKKAWENWHNRAMLTLFETIEEAVHKTNPAIDVGYMSIPGNDKKEWILKSKASKLRPGGGGYNDERPIELFVKNFSVQSQIKNYPADIRDIQYEYEAFNYQTLEKSVHLSELETSLAIMSGCNGVLYNDNIFYDREETVSMLKNSADKWNTLTRVNDSCKPGGIYCADNRISKVLNEIGIPITRYLENSVAAVMPGDELCSLADFEIEALLTKNLLTDGKGVEVLHKRGYGNFCGGKVKAVYDNGMAERFTDSNINGHFKHHYRDVFMNFTFNSCCENAYEMEPSAEAEVVSGLETIAHQPLGCSMYKFEGDSGLRFAADGYLMPESIKSAPKREQLGNLIDWLSCNKLPVRIKKAVKIMPSVTTDNSGGMNIMLTNASFDESGSFDCIVRSDKKFRAISQSGELLSIQQKHVGSETELTIDNLSAWSYILLTNKQ